MRPLDFVSSIKVKLGIVILAATGVAVAVSTLGVAGGLSPVLTALVAGLLALGMVQLLARGMTSPLRDMVAATQAMASGDYTTPVLGTTSRDEVGELARAFNAMAAELAETDRIRRDLVANVSHELRTPIGGLQAALENLVDGVTPPDTQVFSVMLTQTERLGALVAELLDLSRLESGAVPFEHEPVSIRPLLEECAAQSRLARSNVTIAIHTLPDDIVINADHKRLHQVITNLISNAVRVSRDGQTVEVTVRQLGQNVRLEVSDNGPGISEDDRQRVFERFYRADTARSTTNTGAGLGLAIVKWIVELHGGTITPHANKPNGCRMVVVLPKGAT